MVRLGGRSGRWSMRFLAIGLALAGVANARAQEPAASRWVSTDAVLFVEMPRPAVLLDRAADPRLKALFNTVPGLKAALDSGDMKKLRDVVGLLVDKLGLPWDEALRKLTGGGAILAVEAPGVGEPAAALLVTPTDPALLRKATTTLIELARKDAADNGRDDPIKSGEYRGFTGYAIGPKAAYAIVNDTLVIANKGDTIKAVIDRALDGLPADRRFDSSEVYRQRKASNRADEMAWAFARLDRLRSLDPKRFKGISEPDAGGVLLFGGWLNTLAKAPWLSASMTWTDRTLAATLAMPAPSGGGRPAPFQGYIPPAGSGAPGLVHVPGSILSVSLWRDLAAVWEARTELFKPEDVQNLAKLDTFAGQFFGGRDFGTGVLGATAANWRLVVALQDPKSLDPVPDVKLPAFALVADLKPDDPDFAQRLKVAFQSFVGLVNLGAAQSKSPPLELMSETYEGVTLSTTRYMPPPPRGNAGNGSDKAAAKDSAAVHQRHNFSPTATQVGDHFVLSSSRGLARDLVKAFKSAAAGGPLKPEDGTLVAEADGAALAQLVTVNRDRLVMQNILEKGNQEDQARGEVDLLAALLRYLGQGRLAVKDGTDLWKATLEFQLER
ncbi:MAG: hypothetical protein U0794_09140 [Isosphaeraceae bacterium]